MKSASRQVLKKEIGEIHRQVKEAETQLLDATRDVERANKRKQAIQDNITSLNQQILDINEDLRGQSAEK